MNRELIIAASGRTFRSYISTYLDDGLFTDVFGVHPLSAEVEFKKRLSHALSSFDIADQREGLNRAEIFNGVDRAFARVYSRLKKQQDWDFIAREFKDSIREILESRLF